MAKAPHSTRSRRRRRRGRSAGRGLPALLGLLAPVERRRILVHVARGPGDVGRLATEMQLPEAVIARQLRVLEAAGLVRATRRGRRFRIGPCVTAIVGEETAYIRVIGAEGGEAFMTLPLTSLDD